MATEKQIAASRANARRSTGPRTALGKLKSSRNAFRHGLSIPLQSNHAGSEEIHALVKALVEGDTSEVKLLAANNVAFLSWNSRGFVRPALSCLTTLMSVSTTRKV